MELSPQQASHALQDIASAQRRLGIFTGYRHAAPHLWLWGVIWIAGYAATDLWPGRAGWSWLALDAGGIGASLLIAWRQQPRDGERHPDATWARTALRMALFGLAIVLFIFATYDLMQPRSTVQFGLFPVMLMGLLYTLLGLWVGARWLATGLVLVALALAGYHLLAQHVLLFVGLCGGLTLILSGSWMRGR